MQRGGQRMLYISLVLVILMWGVVFVSLGVAIGAVRIHYENYIV